MDNIITVLNNEIAYRICCPANQADLDKFLAICNIKNGLSTRNPTPSEKVKWHIEHQLHIRNGGNPDSFFGVSL